jgi:hypothetical protein
VCVGWQDWQNSPFPRKSFDALWIKHGMVDNIINHSAKEDPFWSFGDNLCIELGSPPYVPMCVSIYTKDAVLWSFFQCLPGLLSHWWDFLPEMFIMIKSPLQLVINKLQRVHIVRPPNKDFRSQNILDTLHIEPLTLNGIHKTEITMIVIRYKSVQTLFNCW